MTRYRVFTICCLFIAGFACAYTLFAATQKPYIPLRYVVSGIQDKAMLKNVNDTLLNLRSHIEVPLTDTDARHFNQKAPRLIQDALKPYGYFRSHVQSSLIKTQKGWLAHYDITPGAPLPLMAIQIEIQGEGKTDRKIDQWLAHEPLHVGDPLNTITYDAIKNSLNDLAMERGYFDAKLIKSQIRINLAAYHAKIIIIFNTGSRYHFGDTSFSTTPFYEKFLRRFLRYHAGQPYNAKKLENTQEGLVTSNYFNQVLITPKPKEATNGQVPIHIGLLPRNSRAYTVGLGYGSYTGIRGTLGLTLRHIGGEGHRFHAIIRGSQKNSSLITRYMIPGPDPARDLFTIGAGASNINQSTGTGHNATFGLTYTLSRGHWKNSLTLAYLNERYNLTNLPFTSTQLVYPTFDTKYLNANHNMNPSRGFSFETQLSGADKNILSRTDFFQILMHIKTLFTIEKTKTRLIFRSDIGHTNIANIAELPLSLQLFAGGSRSVRGYGYNSIGPGRNLVVGSTEIQQRVYGKLYLAGLVDAGVVGNQDLFQHINVGVGPGLAWLTPVGTMELTVAEAPTQSNKPWTIQFTMGTVL